MEKSRAIELLKLAVPIKALTQQEYSDFIEAVNMAIDVLEAQLSRENATSDTISRQAAIDALCKALYDYEDKTEKQFMESDELDVGDWIEHRIFVQNMNDIDRQTILNLPPAQLEPHEGALDLGSGRP